MTLQKRLKEAKMVAEVISPTMLAVVSTLAVGTGIALKSSDDIYDIGRLFYDYVSNHNSLTWETVKTVFDANVTLLSNGKVSVGSDFINICKGAFSNYFSTTEDVSLEGYNFAKYGDIKTSNYFGCVPIYSIPSVLTYSPPYDKRGINIVDLVNLNSDFTLYPFTFKFVRHHGSYYNIYDIYLKDSLLYSGSVISNEKSIWTYKNTLKIFESNGIFTLYIGDSGICRLTEISSFGIPYNPGSWEWDKNYDENKTETGDLPLPIPGDLGNLLGKNPSDIWGNTDSLVGNGDITVPDVSNPSIGLGGSTSFPVEDNTDGSIDIEYNKTVWSNGDLITADKLNNIEDALEMFYKVSQKKSKEIDSATARMVATMPATMLAVVSTLAVGTGIALQGADDIYDIGRIFYDYVESNNELTWDIVKTTFESAKVLNGMISVDRNILDICKDFFDSFFDFKGNSVSSVGTFCGIPILKGVDYRNFNEYSHLAMSLYDGTKIGNIDTARINSSGFMELGTSFVQSLPLSDVGGYKIFIDGKSVYSKIYYFYKNNGSWQFYGSGTFNLLYSGVKGSYVNIPYNGTYDWGSNVNDNVNDLPLPIPGNLNDLIGKSPSDIWGGSYDSGLVGNGNLSIPGVDNPSIGIGGATSFPAGDNTSEDETPDAESGYNKTIWKDDDLITEAKLNKIENAIAVLSPSYEKTNWSNGDIIIAELLNKIENAIEAL